MATWTAGTSTAYTVLRHCDRKTTFYTNGSSPRIYKYAARRMRGNDTRQVGYQLFSAKDLPEKLFFSTVLKLGLFFSRKTNRNLNIAKYSAPSNSSK